MEINLISEEQLNESLSKREVSFSDTSSLLYYTVGDTVDNLNNSAVHIIRDSDFPLSQEKATSHAQSTFNQYMLPEARVILEKLPDELIYSYSKNIGVCSPKSIAKPIRNKNKTRSLNKRITKSEIKQNNLPSNDNCSSLYLSNSHLAEEFHGSNANKIVSETTTVAVRLPKQLNCKISELDKTVVKAKAESSGFSKKLKKHSSNSVQNYPLELPLPTKVKTSDYANKNNSKQNTKSIVSDELIIKKFIASHENDLNFSFDKYLCVHLENLNLGPYLENSSNSFEKFQNENNSDIEVKAEVNVSGHINHNEHVLNKESSSKIVNLCTKASSKDDSGATDSILSQLSSGVYTADGNICIQKESSSKIVNLCTKASSEDDSGATDSISSELSSGVYTADGNICMQKESSSKIINLCTKASSKDDSGAIDSISSELSSGVYTADGNICMQKESIVKDMNSENLNPVKDAQNKSLCILLEKLNLHTQEIDSSFDLPVKIGNICSISKNRFHKIQKCSSPNEQDLSSAKLKKTYTNNYLIHNSENSTATSLTKANKSLSATTTVKKSVKSCEKTTSMQSGVAHSSNLGIKNLKSNVGSNKTKKKINKSVIALLPVEKKRRKKSLKRKKKLYKMIMKYLEMEIKSKKHKKKSKKRKSQKTSRTLDIESDDSISLVYDSTKKNNHLNHNVFAKKCKTPSPCKTVQQVALTSAMGENTKVTVRKKNLVDKHCLGFLSDKVSLRFYNKFFPMEQLLLSKYKLKKNKKKELKKLFSKLKSAGLLNNK